MLQQIADKVKAKKTVSKDELLHLLKNHKGALLAFMVKNNVGNVYFTLRYKLGFTELATQPNELQLARTLEIMLEKNELNEIQTVINNFSLNTKGLDPLMIEQIKNILNQYK